MTELRPTRRLLASRLYAAGAIAALLAAVVAAVGVTAAGSDTHRSGPRANSTRPTSSSVAAPSPPLEVLASSPANGATGVNGATPITFTTTAPIDLAAGRPTIDPALPGTWSAAAHHLTFTPLGAFPPASAVTITLPASLHSIAGSYLHMPLTLEFRTANGSVLRLQQLLATLGYLPLHWTASTPALAGLAASQRAVFDPPTGSFAWAWPAVPPTLAATWSPGVVTVITRGAVMAFETDHQLAVDGIAGPAVWSALLAANPTPAANPNGYTYALASQTVPETLRVWHDGTVISQSPANTGIPQSPTADGTFPVYERLATQIMKGTNPDGTLYADPVAWVAYFNGGDAIHYIGRATYGSRQSLGCVEVPYQVGQTIWPHLSIGTLVTVTG